jgi:hypothetical protein
MPSPGPIEIDRDGAVYYVDAHRARVGKVAADGRRVWEIDGSEWGGEGFLAPGWLALTTGLDLYVLDTGRRKIFQVRTGGEIVGVLAAEDLTDPRAAAVTAAGRLVVYDAAATEVTVRSPSGGILWSFRPQGFRSRTRIGLRLIGGEEEICLYARGSSTVRIYHLMGGLKRTWKPSRPGGGAIRVGSVDFDAAGRAAVLENGRPGLFLFDPLGNPIADLGPALEEAGYAGPGEVRWRDGTLYLSDPGRGNVYGISVPSPRNRSSP